MTPLRNSLFAELHYVQGDMTSYAKEITADKQGDLHFNAAIFERKFDEAEQVLQGKKLIPFWRGKPDGRGVNLRRAFTEPRTFDPIEWFQGTAAVPYLEKGPLTKLADRGMLERIDSAFGGRLNFVGFVFWFN